MLAPAGSYAALVAAVNNGADAGYLGLGALNARRGAANFDLESLAEAARFAHLRGARVYLTANVVVLPEEMPQALEMVDAAWAAGIDAVIVQDLGLLRVLHETLPHVRLHASTQIDAMNPESVLVLSSLGVSRVTLARELPLAGIAACAGSGIEVETFVHGALCYSYSGQCLTSSMVGRRSANRGMCAQPCRLPYELVAPDGTVAETPGRYLLSPKDVAGIAHLPQLIEAGVAALKIEGRMKSPEYVAIVTGVYRAALDRAMSAPESFAVTPAEWDLLDEAFSRGFTDGYLTGARGADLMSYSRPNNRGVLMGRVASTRSGHAVIDLDRALSPGDTLEVWTRTGRFAQPAGSLTVGGRGVPVASAGEPAEIAVQQPVSPGDRVFRVANAALLDAARRTFTGHGLTDHRAAPVRFSLRIRIGEPVRLEARAGAASVEVLGDPVEAARTKPLTVDAIIDHVGRLGGSGYRADGYEIDLEPAAGLGYSTLHALRREALERLDALRLAEWSTRARALPAVPPLPRSASAGRATSAAPPRVVAAVWDTETGAACLAAGADEVLVRVFGAREDVVLPERMRPLLPRIAWPAEVHGHLTWRDSARTVSGNLGTLTDTPTDPSDASVAPVEDARDAQAARAAEADWPLNVLNAHAAAALADLGAPFIWASPELSGRQLAALAASSPVPVGCVVWGRLELMVAEQCVLQASGSCARTCSTCGRRRSWWHLRDRKGYEFPVTTDPTGRSHIMNPVTLDLSRALDEIIAAGVAAVRLDFSDESPARAAEIVRAMRAAVHAAATGGQAREKPLVEPATSGHFYRGVV